MVGVPYNGRDLPELQHLVGNFINMLPLRTRLPSNGASLAAVLQDVQRCLTEALDHSELPFGKMVEGLGVPRSATRTPIFQAIVAMNERLEGGSSSGLVLGSVEPKVNLSSPHLSHIASLHAPDLHAMRSWALDFMWRRSIPGPDALPTHFLLQFGLQTAGQTSDGRPDLLLRHLERMSHANVLQGRDSGPVVTDVVLELNERGDELHGVFQCSSDIFTKASAQRLASSFQVSSTPTCLFQLPTRKESSGCRECCLQSLFKVHYGCDTHDFTQDMHMPVCHSAED